jgi:uncharacterized membrane protein required for colicin V production
VARRSFQLEKEVILTNYVDAVLGILLALAFLRGFSGGLWKSLFNLGSTAAAFGISYLLTGPTVNLVERNYRILGSMSAWWNAMFRSIPGLALPYDPKTFDGAFSAAGGSGWANAFKGALQQNASAVQQVAGPNPTWGTVMGLALARLVLSAAVFFVLLAIFRLLCNLFVGSLAFGSSASFPVRLLGGILETAVSAVWLSILAGVLYPVLNAGLLGNTGEVAEASFLMTGLLRIYRFLWPALMARITVK